MIIRNVFMKTLYDKRWFVFGWTLGLMALTALMVTFYPAMHQDGSLEQLTKSMPPAFQGLVGNLDNLSRFSTYLASQLFDIRMQIIAGVMAIILALGISISEEENGQLRSLTALPISRTAIVVQKWLAMVVILSVTVLGTMVGILLFQTMINESIDLGELARLIFMTWILLIALGSITFAAAMASGLRSVASSVGILVLAVSFIVTTFSVGVDWLKDFESFSIFYFFPAVDIVKEGIQLRDVSVLIGISVVSLVVALIFFRRRDIR